MKKITIIFAFIFMALVLGLSIRGIYGNPTHETINNKVWKDEGPLELSPERGRFALTFSILEDQSFIFALPIARFVTPDLGLANGNYVSLFAPGVSYLLIPGYLIGKALGASQVGSASVIAVFALLNAFLIYKICRRLSVHPWASVLAGFTFLFATPAFAYAVTLYQHHISVFLLLACLYFLLRFKGWWALALIWFLIACAVVVDYPNIFIFFPLGIFSLSRIIWIERGNQKFTIKFQPLALLTFATATLPLVFFLWFNASSNGNPLQLSGTLPSIKAIGADGLPANPQQTEIIPGEFTKPRAQQKSAIRFFNTRNLIDGLVIHFASVDRGIIVFSPVLFFALFGIFSLYKKYPGTLSLLLATAGMTLLLYSMWSDPWGGWAFGSRYLIPAYAVMSILLGVAISNWKRHRVFLLVFFIVLVYSLGVNTLGAITSGRNPPSVELPNLEKISGISQASSYDRNINFLMQNKSKSFVYQTWAKNYLTAWQYYLGLTIALTFVSGSLLTLINLERGKS